MEPVLSGKTAVVTGGSRGIGRAIALRLAQAGAHVVINCTERGVDKAQDVLREIQALNGSAEVKAFSVADSAAVDKAFAEIIAARGAVHVLVNNAGIARDGLVMRVKDEDWDETFDTNLKGAFNCSRAVTRPMMKAREGSIINITSIVGQMGNAGQVAYSASKAGMIGMTKSMAKELASRSVRVNAIAPGFIATEMTADLPATAKDEMLKAIPMGYMGDANTVADAVLFLASPASSYITGQVLAVNGGMYM